MIRNSISLENAQSSDATTIAGLSRDEVEVGLGWSWTEQRVLRSIKNPYTTVLKAVAGTRIAGFGIMTFRRDRANLILLATDPGYRRQGVGSNLLKKLEGIAFNYKIENLYVQVREANTSALAFYEALGYERIDRNKSYYRKREPAIILYRYRPQNRYSAQKA